MTMRVTTTRRRHTRRYAAGLGAVLAAALLAGTSPAPAEAAGPRLRFTTEVTGLKIPWDLTFMSDDLMLFNEKFGRVWSKRGSAAAKPMSISGLPPIYQSTNSAHLGMVADPAAGANKRFYLCFAYGTQTTEVDVRVLRFRLTSDTTAVSDGPPVVTGLPLATDGEHTGCRLRFGRGGRLYVATGDARQGTNPQNLQSLGGKVLRVNADGSIPADNPFVGRGGNARYVWTYGHRNMQGLAVRPGTSELWSAEHGPDRDDEVNLVERGGNYGWDPVPGYNQLVPMTDVAKYPDAKVAKWSSGIDTLATSGATFLQGSAWRNWEGRLAVGLLKDEGIQLMRVKGSGSEATIPSTRGLLAAEGYGRIRTVQLGPDGSLWFTTSNGSNDKIVRITPVP